VGGREGGREYRKEGIQEGVGYAHAIRWVYSAVVRPAESFSTHLAPRGPQLIGTGKCATNRYRSYALLYHFIRIFGTGNAMIGTVNMQCFTILFGFSAPVCVPQSLHCTAPQCRAVLRCAVLCCAVLCCAVPCCAVPCCAALRCAVPCCAAGCAAPPVCFVACLFACLLGCFRSKARISRSAARRCARIEYLEYPGQSPRLQRDRRRSALAGRVPVRLPRDDARDALQGCTAETGPSSF
jgi:hypothetical protein